MSDSSSTRPQAGQRSGQLRLGLREALTDGWAVTNSTIADLVHERTSGIGLFYVLLYCALWGRYREMNGEPPPSNRQLALMFDMKPRTVDRYRDRFDAAFPELDSPEALWLAAQGQVDSDADPEVVAFILGSVRL